MKSMLRYPGSKWRIAEWIISHFQKHKSYLEPFFGSGAVLFNKSASDIETVNDLNGDVVNLFRVIRQNPEALSRAVYFTPHSREEYERAWSDSPEKDVEKARIFLVKSRNTEQCRKGIVSGRNDMDELSRQSIEADNIGD